MRLSRLLKTALCTAVAACGLASQAHAQVVISQIYPGGGNTGATYISDFVDLHNVSDCPVDLTGWSLQYASATGTSWTSASLVGVVQPGKFFLVQLATPTGFAGTQGMPFPINSSGSANLDVAGGKLALVRASTVALTGACPTGTNIVDFVGYGAAANCREGASAADNAPAPGDNVRSILRNPATGSTMSCNDTGNNAADFGLAVAAAPRNSNTAAALCSAVLARACCNDATGACVTYTTSIACPTGFTAQGAGICCTPNQCPVPIGTCCTNQFCNTGISLTLCTQTGGVFLGVGVSCSPNPCVPPPVRISQIYGGGGEAGAPYDADFVELYNAGSTPVNLAGWSLQYATATGAFTQNIKFSDNTLSSTTIAANGYYLVKLGAGTTMGLPSLPAPDFVQAAVPYNMAFTAGRLALVTNTTQLANCPGLPRADVADYVGFGAGANCSEFAATGIDASPSTSLTRRGNGCVDNNNNLEDFMQPLPPTPRNSASPTNPCLPTDVGACCIGSACSLTNTAGCSGVYMGPTTTCTPNDPCAPQNGRCCLASGACTVVTEATCTANAIGASLTEYVSWSLGGTCTTNLCLGACCTGITCTTVGRDQCTASNSYWVFGTTCPASGPFCTQPVPVQVGDIAYGASVNQDQDAVWQIRGALGASAMPVRVGTWSRYDFLQYMRFDNSFNTRSNARGNLLGLNFGASIINGASIHNVATNGDLAGGQTLYRFESGNPLNPFNMPPGRYAGLSISPNNQYLACVSYDNSRVVIMKYEAGTQIGTGFGASITNAWSVGFPGGFGPTDLSFSALVSGATVWINDTTLAIVVRNTNPGFLDASMNPIPLAPAIFTIPMSPTGPGTPVYRMSPSDAGIDSSRTFGMAYDPSVSPYIYMSNSSFAGSTSNTLVIIDPATWTEVRALGFTASCNTGRELAIGPDKYLYFNQFAGSGSVATSPILDRLNLDQNGDNMITPIDAAAINDNFVTTTTDFFFKGTANTANFSGLGIATGASHVVCCRGVVCVQILATDCVNNIPGVGTVASFSWPCSSNGNSYSTCCFADFNHDGIQSIDDLFLYFNAYFGNSPWANFGGDGSATPTIDDLFLYINAYFGTCTP